MTATTLEAHLSWDVELFDRLFRRWQDLTGERPETFASRIGCSRSRLDQLRSNPRKLPSVVLAHRVARELRAAGEEYGEEALLVETDSFIVED